MDSQETLVVRQRASPSAIACRPGLIPWIPTKLTMISSMYAITLSLGHYTLGSLFILFYQLLQLRVLRLG
jgi:hypothetical protein